jgi:hypothetical protein
MIRLILVSNASNGDNDSASRLCSLVRAVSCFDSAESVSSSSHSSWRTVNIFLMELTNRGWKKYGINVTSGALYEVELDHGFPDQTFVFEIFGCECESEICSTSGEDLQCNK